MKKELFEIFKNLEGEWSFNRKIYDAINDNNDFASGITVFSFNKYDTNKNILNYEETGILQLSQANKQLNFKRKYVYKYHNEEIEIYLDDGLTKGKLFQKLISKNNQKECSFVGTEHICRLDKHNGQYNFKNNHEFETFFTIEGEHKRIEIATSFKKVTS